MSCNGCRVLRKGCSENCMLRQCLQCIESPQAQAHATVFVAKFFGRACLLSFLSCVPLAHRPALFQSLLYEACGRTVNPVTGAVGLLWTGNWHLCESAVETVLRGGTPTPAPGIFAGFPTSDEVSVVDAGPSIPGKKRKVVDNDMASRAPCDLDLRLTASRGVSPSRQSEESVTTSLETGMMREREEDGKLLLFL